MATQTKLAIDESDIILFIVDARSGLNSIDEHIAEIIRKNDKVKMLLVNKAEGMLNDNALTDFYKLGFNNIHKISSAHGDGISELKDFLVEQDTFIEKYEDKDTKYPKISIVGRPNVGKSTLINAFLGEDRFIAFDKPGTTRDAVSADFHWGKDKFVITDTAGIRKKGKVFESVEKFSVIKTLNAINLSNVSVLVIDSSEGISAQDMHILGFILESGKSLVIALNKWDSISSYEKALTAATYKFNKKKEKGFSISKNKIIKKEDVILPMGAHKIDDNLHKIIYPALIQRKLDGFRCMSHITNGKVKLLLY